MSKRFEVGDTVQARRCVDAGGDTFEGRCGVIVDTDGRAVRVDFGVDWASRPVVVWCERRDIRHAYPTDRR